MRHRDAGASLRVRRVGITIARAARLGAVALFTLLALLTALAASCARPQSGGDQPAPRASDDAGAPRRGGSLIVGASGIANSFDPIISSFNPSIWANLLLYGQLVRVRADGLGVEPDVAESWEASSDGRVYTFHLRPGVVFSDGAPVLASDVKFSLLRAATDKSSVGVSLFPRLTIETPDDRTVIVRTEAPWPAALSVLSLFASSILPEAYFNQVGSQKLNNAPIGSGPFLAERRPGQFVVLKRNPHYWDRERPYLDEVRFVLLPDPLARMLKLQAGEVDVAEDVPFNQVERLRSFPRCAVQSAPIMSTGVVLLNPRAPIFQDVNARRAIDLAIDREEIVRLVFFGHAEVSTSFLPRMMYSGLEPPVHDLTKARELLAASAYPHGFSATLFVIPGSLDQEIAIVLQSQLKQLGVRLEIQRLESPFLRARVEKGDYDSFLETSITSDVIDPSQLTDAMVLSSEMLPKLWAYQNPRVDELARRSKEEMNPERRAAMFLELQRAVRDDAVILGLVRMNRTTAVRDTIHGLMRPPTSNYRLWEVWKSL